MPKTETGFATSYIEFARTLRTWFVAYGIGAPVLILSQEPLQVAFLKAPDARLIAWCFLGGVALQITQALIFKVAMWYLYMGELTPSFTADWRYKASDWISLALWLELAFDIGSLGLFGIATFRIIGILVA